MRRRPSPEPVLAVSGSFPTYDRVVRHLLQTLAPSRALDLGAGSGKYGRLLREIVPDCLTTAVEIEAATIADFQLDTLYADVVHGDAGEWVRGAVDAEFDLVVVGDCLQQMPKSRGLDLLNEIVYRSAWVLVTIPEFVRQGRVGGLDSAVHRSTWSERDFAWHDLWAWDNCRTITLVLMRGLAASARTIDEVVLDLAARPVSILDFDGTVEVRPCRLRLCDQPRESAYRPR